MRAAGTMVLTCLCLAALTGTASATAPGVRWADAAGREGVAHLRGWETARRPATAHAAAVWAACGWRDPDDKLVRLFQRDRRRDFALRCGDAGWGYRHILDRHRGDFERMAAGTFQNWRDVADLSLAALSSDPDVVRPAGGDQTCRSRVIFLINVRNGQTVRQQTVRMFTDNGSGNIRSAFPSPHCP
jgi:hypothetical protein